MLVSLALPGVLAVLTACSGAPASPAATAPAKAASTTAAATPTATATAATAAATAAPAKASPTATTTTTAGASAATPAASTPAGTPAAPKATPPPAAPAPPRVTSVTSSISNFAFAAASGSAPLVVRWVNNDTVDHDVVFADGSSPVLPAGASFERRFDQPGSFAYTCSFHPFMTGTVTVR